MARLGAIALTAIRVVVSDPGVLAGGHAVALVLLAAERSPVEQVVHGELTSPFEKLTEAHRALRSLEHIFLLDSHHREAPPGLGQLVALVVELLFPRKELLARHQPFLSRHDFWKTHLSFPRSFGHAL